jgi:hypothetical protein
MPKGVKTEPLDELAVDEAFSILDFAALFEINKGCNKMPETDVNAPIARNARRIPFRNMVYIGDSPSDIPCFSLVSRFGGRTYGVYERSDREGDPSPLQSPSLYLDQDSHFCGWSPRKDDTWSRSSGHLWKHVRNGRSLPGMPPAMDVNPVSLLCPLGNREGSISR